jgi:gamma-glutamylcyclotransferase (GGCT)/AIG2-like uncharacterized protein YtfP
VARLRGRRHLTPLSPDLPLFVYGTLAAAGAEGPLLAHLDRVPAHTRGELWALPAGYPALVLKPGTTSLVYGELVDPPDPRLLTLLDQYEGVAEGLYRRVVLETVSQGRAGPAWAWVMDAARARTGVRLPDGRWHGRPTHLR